MKLGFTGTRRGTTEPQQAALYSLMRELNPTEIHHGDCVGADAEFANFWAVQSRVQVRSVSHPCNFDPTLRAHVPADETRPELTAFARNRNIVNEVDWMIATPAEMTQQPRGGTWYTIGYARKARKLLAIVYPDGSVERFDSPRA